MKSKAGMHDMTTGDVRAHLLRMTLFVVVAIALQSLYSLVDMYWVGRLGKEAVAAISLSSNLQFVAIAMTQMLAAGCVALVSQAAGRKDETEVQRLFNQAQSLGTVAGLLFLVVGLTLRRTYAERLAGDAATAALAADFLVVFIPALALQFSMAGLGAALRGIGDMKPALIAQTGSIVLNMVLAPFLVLGWGTGHAFGVVGAGISTAIATLAAVVGLTLYLYRRDTYLRLRFADWKPDLRTWWRMLDIGLPAGAEFFLMFVTIAVTYSVMKPFGAEAQAGFGIGSRLMQTGMMPAIALGFAVSTVVGQNFGAKAFDRVRETIRESTKLAVLTMIVWTVICQLLAPTLLRPFTGDAAVVAAGVIYMQTVSWVMVPSGVAFATGGVFQGLGNTWPSLMAYLLRAASFVAIVLVWSKQPGFAMRDVFVIAACTTVLQFVAQQVFLRGQMKKKLRSPEEDARAEAAITAP